MTHTCRLQQFDRLAATCRRQREWGAAALPKKHTGLLQRSPFSHMLVRYLSGCSQNSKALQHNRGRQGAWWAKGGDCQARPAQQPPLKAMAAMVAQLAFSLTNSRTHACLAVVAHLLIAPTRCTSTVQPPPMSSSPVAALAVVGAWAHLFLHTQGGTWAAVSSSEHWLARASCCYCTGTCSHCLLQTFLAHCRTCRQPKVQHSKGQLCLTRMQSLLDLTA